MNPWPSHHIRKQTLTFRRGLLGSKAPLRTARLPEWWWLPGCLLCLLFRAAASERRRRKARISRKPPQRKQQVAATSRCQSMVWSLMVKASHLADAGPGQSPGAPQRIGNSPQSLEIGDNLNVDLYRVASIDDISSSPASSRAEASLLLTYLLSTTYLLTKHNAENSKRALNF